MTSLTTSHIAPQKNGTVLRVLVLSCAVVLCFGMSMFALTGCVSDKSTVKNIVKQEYDVFKAKDDNLDTLKALVESEELSRVGVDSTELVNAWLDGYKYKVTDASVSNEGTEAWVNVEVTCRPLVVAVDGWSEAYITYATQAGLEGTSQEEIQAAAGTMLLDEVTNTDKAETIATVHLVKQDNQWILAEDGKTAITQSVLGNFASSTDEALESSEGASEQTAQSTNNQQTDSSTSEYAIATSSAEAEQ